MNSTERQAVGIVSEELEGARRAHAHFATPEESSTGSATIYDPALDHGREAGARPVALLERALGPRVAPMLPRVAPLRP